MQGEASTRLGFTDYVRVELAWAKLLRLYALSLSVFAIGVAEFGEAVTSSVRGLAGPALANSELGNLPCYRVTSIQITRWFLTRHPEHLAPATVKRGMSALRGFLTFCINQRWMDESVLEACFSVPDSNPRREWLHPEQHDAIANLVERTDELDDDERFAYGILGDLGVRTDEATRLRANHLDPRSRIVRVVGKGRGQGKERSIPVDDVIIARWHAHIQRYGIRGDGHMLFHRQTRFIGGSNENYEWVIDKSRPISGKPLRTVMQKITKLAEREFPLSSSPTFISLRR